MHSLAQEIRSFSRANLRKQRTRVTTLTGRRIIETWRGACLQVEEEGAEAAPGGGGGYVQDLSADLQVGVVKPWLLLGSQDAAHDLETMRKYKVTHVLNVAYGVQNVFLNEFIYKTISILDLPETDITSYFPECFEFIEKAKIQNHHRRTPEYARSVQLELQDVLKSASVPSCLLPCYVFNLVTRYSEVPFHIANKIYFKVGTQLDQIS
ncbi:dual specificity protein phosphatase 19 isoform X2 [Harpia harpyja]|uniref:dual specificity protein phosphatase 19 isoform X2 n=1 Tax=Harpia harpyja TaxID=202280 RepID=UPI0022B10B50|nr:dual specificity protein phosphatase 19 isoform X2 [Harpia harpyja]